MKVIEAISDMNIGGAGRLLLTRLANSSSEGTDTVVLLPKGSMLKSKFSDIGVSTRSFEGCSDRSFDVGAIGGIARIIKEEKPDIVNSHGCMSARIAAFLCRVPVRIHTRHCAYPVPLWQRIFPVKQIIGGLNAALSHRTIAVACAARRNLLDMGMSDDRITVIINGVDRLRKYGEAERREARRRLGLEHSFVVGICARVEKCKDHESFLRAARILSLEDEKYRFVIVGDGSMLGEMKALASALGIEDKVIFTGFTDDVEEYFNVFDINVNCSVGTETSSLALSEGMSIGLPSVASSYGGNTYMVRHGENGFIYSQRDFTELADMIRRIASSPSLYEHMSDKAYERYSEELNSEKMTRETEALYKELYREYTLRAKARLSGNEGSAP
ncbi:MAG: glycosyltransferase [Clostridia bacterium]|nr:glycosyltransferase [Clostridia bacterium]